MAEEMGVVLVAQQCLFKISSIDKKFWLVVVKGHLSNLVSSEQFAESLILFLSMMLPR